jgi:hypothetical protein
VAEAKVRICLHVLVTVHDLKESLSLYSISSFCTCSVFSVCHCFSCYYSKCIIKDKKHVGSIPVSSNLFMKNRKDSATFL